MLDTADSLHSILRGTYDQMIDMCGNMIAVATGIAGIGALLYIAYRVWQSLARAEPIDVFPLLRPFAIGLAIMFFVPIVIKPLNGVLSPITVGCNQLLRGQVIDMKTFQQAKDEMQAENDKRAYMEAYMAVDETMDQELDEIVQWDQEDLAAAAAMYESQRGWGIGKIFKRIFRWLLELLFSAASVILDTVRTFYLIVLTILGPIAFAISVYDGFQSSMTHWFAKYISVYLWLPIADLFGAILGRLQTLSIERDMALMASNPFYMFDEMNNVYSFFLLIGIIGYFCIPSIATWVVQATGFGTYNRTVARTSMSVANYASSFMGATLGNVWGRTLGGNSNSKGGQSGGGGGSGSTNTATSSSGSGSPK